MVLKSSILACALAGVAITQALPMTDSKVTIDKRHKKPLPTALPAAAGLTPDQQFIICLVNTLYNPPKDKSDRLEYEELIDGCAEVVYNPKGATAASGDSSEHHESGSSGTTTVSSKPGDDAFPAAGSNWQQAPGPSETGDANPNDTKTKQKRNIGKAAFFKPGGDAFTSAGFSGDSKSKSADKAKTD
ncbi:unnamed protein product [Absidia cylindrospora]